MKIVIIENVCESDYNNDPISYERIVCAEYSSPEDLIRDLAEDQNRYNAEYGPFTNRLNLWQQAYDKKNNELRKLYSILRKTRENLGNLMLIPDGKRRPDWQQLVEEKTIRAASIKTDIDQTNRIEIADKPVMNYVRKFKFDLPYGAEVISLDEYFERKRVVIE